MESGAFTSAARSRRVVRDVARVAREAAPAFGVTVWERVVAELREARTWERSIVDAGPATAEALVRELVGHLDDGADADAMHAPALGLAHARHFARDGIPVTALLRVYQLGHECWRDFYAEELGRVADSAEQLLELSNAVSAVTFRYLYEVTQEVVSAYEEERTRVAESGERARRRTLEAILAGERISAATVAVRLGVDLTRSHTALVAWAAPDQRGQLAAPDVVLERLLRETVALTGVERPLVVSSGWTTAWAWLTRAADPDGPRMDELLGGAGLVTDGLAIAIGREAPGEAGFRHSHQEAQAARRFATRGGAAMLTYAAVELASLVAADAERGARFVRRELGGLAAPGEAAVRLRRTLAAYLAEESSATRTALALGVHKNTVLYRVRQAEQRRGLPLHARRLELEAALQLADALPELLEV